MNKIKRSDYISLTETRAKFHTVNFYPKATFSTSKRPVNNDNKPLPVQWSTIKNARKLSNYTATAPY